MKQADHPITSYSDINDILIYISNGIENILETKLVGLYLFGSLAYGDFNPDTSDIDLVTIVKAPLNPHQLRQIKELHSILKVKHPKWSLRLECSYITIDLLDYALPPKQSRAYYSAGIFYDAAPFGNEWIINNCFLYYLLYHYGIPLLGSSFKDLIKPIDILEIQKVFVRDLLHEWKPRINDLELVNDSHYQSYLVLNLCRILYTIFNGATATKKVSAQWVKSQYGNIWETLIVTAENWKHGAIMTMRDEVIQFIQFAIDEIKMTPIYQVALVSDQGKFSN